MGRETASSQMQFRKSTARETSGGEQGPLRGVTGAEDSSVQTLP